VQRNKQQRRKPATPYVV